MLLCHRCAVLIFKIWWINRLFSWRNLVILNEYMNENHIKLPSHCKCMQFKREVVESLKRELSICNVALSNIKEKLGKFEIKYTMSTEEFNEKYEKGQLGDEQDFFEWNAYNKYYNDWQNRKRALEEILS